MKSNSQRCRWEQEDAWDFSDIWDTECGHTFCFTDDGGPCKDGIDYCCYCGRRIKAVPAKEGGVNIDRAVYEGGIGPETATSTGEVSDRCDRCNCALTTAGVCVLCGWSRSTAPRRDVSAIETVIGTFERRGRVKIANEARAELATLRARAQEEFDIASGYYKQLQKAKDTAEAQAAEIGRLRQVAQLAADMAGEDDGRALAAMAEMTAIVAKEALFDFPVDPPSPTPTGKIERLQRAASRACSVMSECVEHSECSGADRAEMKAAKQQLLDALLGNCSESPKELRIDMPGVKLAPEPPATLCRLVPVERLRDLEWSHHGKCPVCDDVGPFPTDAPGTEYHASDCWLAKAIKGDTCQHTSADPSLADR